MSDSSVRPQLRRRFWSTVLGHDIFISYRRRDAALYVDELARELDARGLTCFVDREETVGGVALSPALGRALKRSRTLVVVLTPGAMRSEWMLQEIEAYNGRARHVIPISVGGFLSAPPTAIPAIDRLRGVSWIDEAADAVSRGQPGAGVVREIEKAHGHLRVRRIANVMIGTSVLALGGIGFGLERLLVEGKRQATLFKADARAVLAEFMTLCQFLVFAAQGYRFQPIQPKSLTAFSQFADKDALKVMGSLNLAQPNANHGPVIGFGAVYPPGGERPAVVALAESAKRIRTKAIELSMQQETAVDAELLDLWRLFAQHDALLLLASAKEKMDRYHRIEDSEILAYRLQNGPGVGLIREPDLVDVLMRADKLSAQLD